MESRTPSHEPPLSVRLLAWVAALELEYNTMRTGGGYSTHRITGPQQDIRSLSAALKRLGVAHGTSATEQHTTLTIKHIWTPGARNE